MAHIDQNPAKTLSSDGVLGGGSNLGAELVVEEDILRLHIEVDDVIAAFFVEVSEGARCAERDVEPLLPVEQLLALLFAEQPGVQAAVRHELVDEQAMGAFGAEAVQTDEVEVPDGAHGRDLGSELLLPLHRCLLQHLHCHSRAVCERPLVH